MASGRSETPLRGLRQDALKKYCQTQTLCLDMPRRRDGRTLYARTVPNSTGASGISASLLFPKTWENELAQADCRLDSIWSLINRMSERPVVQQPRSNRPRSTCEGALKCCAGSTHLCGARQSRSVIQILKLYAFVLPVRYCRTGFLLCIIPTQNKDGRIAVADDSFGRGAQHKPMQPVVSV